MSQALSDRFGRDITYMRLSVTDRCNFRCVYCMPAEGLARQPAATFLSYEELRRVVGAMALCGVRRVRLTGGEPLVRRDLPVLVKMLTGLDGIDEVVMTTNGALLDRYAPALKDAGLGGLTVSLDSLCAERFARITRGGSLERVLAGIEAATAAGFAPIKVNTVVVRGFNDDELLDLTSWAMARGHLLRFIEFMPIGADTAWDDVSGNGCVPASEMRAALGQRWDLAPLGMVEGAGPSRYCAVRGAGAPEGARIGFISAVTECFCDACNRIRLTPQGGIRACLADDSEVDIRALLRGGATDDELVDAIRAALWGKKETHRFDIDGGSVTRKQMISIGG